MTPEERLAVLADAVTGHRRGERPGLAAPRVRAGGGRDARRRGLRAWELRGEPERPRMREGRTTLEARVLNAHYSGTLMLGEPAERAHG